MRVGGPWRNFFGVSGNSAAVPVDYPCMTCDEIRVALSARLDGEDPQAPPGRLDGHLAGCPGCRSWLDRAEQVTRSVRLQAVQVPDLPAAVLAAVAADGRAGHASAAARQAAAARGRRQVLRVAVALAAVAQLVMAVQVLLGGVDLGGFVVAADPHTSREVASFDVALAVGFGFAAWRPERAGAFVPVAFVLAGCLAVTSAVDVANASTALVHEVGHLVAVAQAVLLWALGRTVAGPAGNAGGTAVASAAG